MNTQKHTRHLVGSILCAISFLIATGTTAFAQSSGQTRPFSAVIVGLGDNPIPNDLSPLFPAWESVIVGKATHLGKTGGYGLNFGLAWGGSWTGDTIGFHLVGVAVTTLVAANGDELEITNNYRYYLTAFLPPGSPYADVVLGEWEITGGTGRFENAIGSGTSEGRRDNEDEERVHVYKGRINY